MPGSKIWLNGKRVKVATSKKSKPISNKTFNKKVSKVINQKEPYKYIVDSLSTSSVGTAWVKVLNISNIPWTKEENPHTRCSTKALIKGLALSLKMQCASGDTTNQIRVALVRGRRSGVLNMTNVSMDPNNSGDDLHLQFNQRYVDVIYDKTFNVQEIAAGAVFPNYRTINKFFKINKTSKYTEAPDPTVQWTTQPYNNTALYLIACSDSSLAPNPRFSGQSRISYKDLD